MSTAADLPEALQIGLRTLSHVPELTLDDAWDLDEGVWTVRCELRVRYASEYVPEVTYWYLRVADTYPRGKMQFNPAYDEGIQVTFPHQTRNAPVKGAPFLAGNPCLTDPDASLGKAGDNIEQEDAYGRLAWHAQRLVQWVEDAARDRLLQPGDPFEHPAVKISSRTEIAYFETEASFTHWDQRAPASGIVELVRYGHRDGVWYPLSFTSEAGPIFEPPWGTNVLRSTQKQQGLWLLVPTLPKVSPWGYPSTWGELREVLAAQGIDLIELLRAHAETWRDRQLHLFFLGYPVPKRMGEVNGQIYWQACLIPALATPRQFAKGFRPNELGRWMRDRQKVLADTNEISWLKSCNVQPDELGSRGYLPKALRDLRYVLVGGGALGSSVAEHLVRTGVTSISIIDPEILERGNLVRHTLSDSHLNQPKAVALAAHLNELSPLAQVVGHAESVPAQEAATQAAIETSDVIIDTTGSDEVIEALAQLAWPDEKVVASLSLGWQAQSLYAYAERTRQFNAKNFHAAVAPEVTRDLESTAGDTAPWEGVGCWTPVFPALHTDVQLLAAAGVKFMRYFLESKTPRDFTVFEQVQGQFGFEGVRRRLP